MSVSSQRATETQRAAYAALVDSYAKYQRVRDTMYVSAEAGRQERTAARDVFYAALDMYSMFTGEDTEAVHDEVVESYQDRMEMNS